MTTGIAIFIGIGIFVEVYYWIFWFPKAYKKGSTQEIREIKKVVNAYKNGEIP